ncbi:hypothetical protein [Salmonella enterica]|uniref:hypothetical protein n=1 Tax=Salmonella enterica TaxID=28901 RepID=UPI0039EF36D8
MSGCARRASRLGNSVSPLRVACADGALEIITGQAGDDITVQGSQLAQTLGLVAGGAFEPVHQRPAVNVAFAFSSSASTVLSAII